MTVETVEPLTDEEIGQVLAEPTGEAPYGITKDGTPRRKPGPAKGTKPATTRSRRTPRRTAPRPPTPAGPTGPRTKPAARATDYTAALEGLLQVVTVPLAMAGRSRPTLALDAWAISTHAPNVAAALNALAQEEPAVAAVLEKIVSLGPYGALIGACLPMVMQIAHNHGLIGEAPGVVQRDQLMAGLVAQGQTMAAGGD